MPIAAQNFGNRSGGLIRGLTTIPIIYWCIKSLLINAGFWHFQTLFVLNNSNKVSGKGAKAFANCQRQEKQTGKQMKRVLPTAKAANNTPRAANKIN